MDDALESRILDALYRGVTDAAALRSALEMLATAFACPSAAFIAFDAQEPVAGLTMTTGIFAEEDVQRRYLEYAALDPAPGLFASIAVGRATTTDRIMSEDVRRTSQFGNEFYRPLGLSETLGGNLFSDQGRFALIGLHRSDDRGAFTDAEIAAVERLSPHLRRILQLRRQFWALEAKNSALQAVLDGLPSGLLLLDERGSAIFINKAMHAIVQRGDAFFLDAAGFLLPRNSDARRIFLGLLHDVMHGGAGGALSVPSSRSERGYPVLIARVPAALAEPGWPRRRRAGALVIVHDPASRFPARSDILRQTLDLPEGAAQLALALCGDDDLKTFAERQGITIHTARFHLRTALARTGTRTQAELMRLVIRVLRDFALGGRADR
ncbi:MAG: hypothetical protein AB7V13_21755 [Pseudorhodoplanes sp.]